MTTHDTFSPSPGVTLAFHKTEAQTPGLPGVIFLGGFMSDMTGTKATFLEDFCKQRGMAYLRFDYQGHGASSGDFEQGNISTWKNDALAIFDALTEGPQIVVGSSMGGWISLLLSLARKERVVGLIGLAAAPDFTEDTLHGFTQAQRETLKQEGKLEFPNLYGAPYPLTAQLFEDGRKNLLLTGPIALDCPVRLIHGKKDPDVPWQKSEQTLDKLTSANKKIIWIEDGDHRLSRPQDLKIIGETIDDLREKAG